MRVQNSTFFPLDNGELFCPIFCASILKCLLQVPCSQRVEVPLILDTTPLWVDISTNCAPPRTWRTKQSECLRLSVRLLIFFSLWPTRVATDKWRSYRYTSRNILWFNSTKIQFQWKWFAVFRCVYSAWDPPPPPHFVMYIIK